MYLAIDGDVAEKGPSPNANFIIAFFFVGFMLVGQFFLMNLFTGAICYHFDKAQKNEKSLMHNFLTEE